jgi:hypothetical protein
MSSEQSVLNPMLYRRLLSRFGEVKVRHQGEKRVVRPAPLSDEAKGVVRQWGEQYMTACPFCRNQEYQLSISYMYGKLDDAGRQLTNLAYCHANKCLKRYENRVALAEMLNAKDGFLENASIRPGKVLSEEDRIMELPSPRTRIDQLHSGHPAKQFLACQGFDPVKVGKYYLLYWCDDSDDPLIRNRIIIPVYMHNKLQGWQSLSLDKRASTASKSWPPKYLSGQGMQTSTLLYNLDKAREYETCVVVREPINVWAFGRMAVCLLGGMISEKQEQLLKAVFRKKQVVLLLNEAHAESLTGHSLRTALRKCFPGNLLVVEHPANVAPGTEGRKVLRALVSQKAEDRGFAVSLKKTP